MTRAQVHQILGEPTESSGDGSWPPLCDSFAYQAPDSLLYTHVRYQDGIVEDAVTSRAYLCGLTDPVGELQVIEGS